MKIDKDRYTERYYYLRESKDGNPGKHPFGCVCLLMDKETGKYYRGISICSPKESSFVKVIGRGVAKKRAYSAIDAKDSYWNTVVTWKRSGFNDFAQKVRDTLRHYGIGCVSYGYKNKSMCKDKICYFSGEALTKLTPFEERLVDEQ